MDDLHTSGDNGSMKPDLHTSRFNGTESFTEPGEATTFSDGLGSAPSSPGRGPPRSYGGGFFYSAPASPLHHMLSSYYANMDSSNSASSAPLEGAGGSSEFEFTVRQEPSGSAPSGSMSSADELFLNGQIRPMKLSSHLQRPQLLAPLIGLVGDDGEDGGNGEDRLCSGRDLKSRDRYKTLRRRARSMSPLRNDNAFPWLEEFNDGGESREIKKKLEAQDKQRADDDNETPSSGASSRSSSVGRSSKRWVFLKELLYRSKSEGRSSSSRNHKFWSFSPSAIKDKKSSDTPTLKTGGAADESGTAEEPPKTTKKKAVNGVSMKRKVGRSPHEVHYTTNRLQAEEMRKKTYLPYRHGLLGCLGFSSRSYGAMNGFARALNPVSSS